MAAATRIQFPRGFSSPIALALLLSAAQASAAPPPNDECAGAVLIGCNQTVIADNSEATIGPGDFWTCRINGGMGAGSIWYRFVATHTSARIQTCASTGGANDSILQVFSGACGSLVSIGCNDDGCSGWLSLVDVGNLTVGQTYYIQMSSWTAASLGPYTLEVICPRPSAVPNCSNPLATVTTADLPVTIEGTFTGAAPDPGPPTLMICGAPPARPARWIRIVSTSVGGIDLAVHTRNEPALLCVYQGEMCGGLLCHAFGGQGRVRFPVSGSPESPVTYHAAVTQPFGSEDPDWSIDISSFDGFCSIPIPPGAQQENEPNCGVPLDTTNGGCNFSPPRFTVLQLGAPFAGTLAHHTPGGGAVDTDWFQITLDQTTTVSVTGSAAAPMLFGFMQTTTPNPTGGCHEMLGTLGTSATTSVDGGCAPATFSATLGQGVWTLVVRPDPSSGWTFTCGSPQGAYLVRVDDAATNSGCQNPVAQWTIDDLPATAPIALSPNAGAELCTPQQGQYTAWARYVSSEERTLLASLPIRGPAAAIGVYRGDTCEEAICVAQSTSGNLRFEAEGSPQNPTTYHIAVSHDDMDYLSELALQIDLLCDIFFPPLAQPENEPDCGLPVDTTNGGCGSSPASFGSITVGTPLRGSIGYNLGGAADTDWFQFHLDGPQTIVVSAQAEFNGLFGVVQTSTPAPTGACSEMLEGFIASAITMAGHCEPANFSIDLGAGVWTVVMRPDPERDWTFPCGSPQGQYVLLIKNGDVTDCNANGVADEEEIAAGARDCFNPAAVSNPHTAGGPDGILDECQCVADWNRDGVVNSSDIAAFITSWLSDIAGGAPDADITCDGLTNSSDISFFITLWLAAVQHTNPFDNCP